MTSSGRHSRFPAVDRTVKPVVSLDDRRDLVARRASEGINAEVTEVPADMNVVETLIWVGDDASRKEAVLVAEKARLKPRKGVLEGLSGE